MKKGYTYKLSSKEISILNCLQSLQISQKQAFPATLNKLSTATRLTTKEVRGAIHNLKKHHCIITKRVGFPPTTHFTIKERAKELLQKVNNSTNLPLPLPYFADLPNLCNKNTNLPCITQAHTSCFLILKKHSVQLLAPKGPFVRVGARGATIGEDSFAMEEDVTAAHIVDSVFGGGPRKKKDIDIPNTPAGNLLAYWESLGLVKHERMNKPFRNALEAIEKALNGTLFRGIEDAAGYDRRYTKEEIKTSFDRFALAALDPDYYPEDKRHLRRLTVANFFYSPFSKWNRSQFVTYLNNEPELVEEANLIENDPNSLITTILAEEYAEVTGSTFGSFKLHDKKKFVKASAMIVEFFNENKHRIPIHFRDVENLPAYLVEALAGQFDNLMPGNLCSDFAFTQALPQFMFNQAILDIDTTTSVIREPSIYDPVH